MCNYAVNIADFRSLHVLKARRQQDAIQGRPSARFTPALLPSGQRFDWAVEPDDSQVFDIGTVREAWYAQRHLKANRGRHRATVLRFANGASRQNATAAGEVETTGMPEGSDPLDCPPAA
jgi:hypothetical protein